MAQTDVYEGMRNHQEVFAAELDAATATVEAVISDRPECFSLEELGLRRHRNNSLAYSEAIILERMTVLGRQFGFTACIAGGQADTARSLVLSYEVERDNRTIQLPARV